MSKRFHRFFRDRRAITPVLSNLLLTVVAVAVMALATTASYVITTNLRDTMSERIVIEDLWFSNFTNSIDVYLRNVGRVSIQISGVYLNHSLQPLAEAFRLEIGRHQWLSISQAWIPGSMYYVEIVTTRGTHVADYFRSP